MSHIWCHYYVLFIWLFYYAYAYAGGDDDYFSFCLVLKIIFTPIFLFSRRERERGSTDWLLLCYRYAGRRSEKIRDARGVARRGDGAKMARTLQIELREVHKMLRTAAMPCRCWDIWYFFVCDHPWTTMRCRHAPYFSPPRVLGYIKAICRLLSPVAAFPACRLHRLPHARARAHAARARARARTHFCGASAARAKVLCAFKAVALPTTSHRHFFFSIRLRHAAAALYVL